MNISPFPFTIIKCQLASSNKRTFYIFLFTITKCQVANSNKRTISQLPYNFLISVIPRVSGQEVSPKSFVFINFRPNQYDSRQPCSPVKLHYPQAESDPFSSTNLGIPLSFLILVKSYFPPCIHNCITSTHSILGQKWGTVYLSLFDRQIKDFIFKSPDEET